MTERLLPDTGPLLKGDKEQNSVSPSGTEVGRGGGKLPAAWEVAALVLITLLAAALRFYQFTELPPGLHFDEGFQGVSARYLIDTGSPQIYFESDMGEEPIAIHLVALALVFLGQEPWVIRLPSALIGTLTVPLAWWLGRELYSLARRGGSGRSRSRRIADLMDEPGGLAGQMVGLGSALVLALLYWHLSFSRIGMEPILVPFFATLAFAAMARGLNSDSSQKLRPWPFALAGLALGGCLYTYKAGYFVPVLAVLFVAYAAIVEPGFLRRHGRGLFVTGLVALLVAAPIAFYFATHPANFLQRPASVALVAGEPTPAGPWQALADNLPRVLGMFFVQGDANPRSNLPGRPALDPFLATLFLLGLGRALVGVRRPALALPPMWVGVMSLPTLLTEHAPHFGRAIGATPAVALLCALGGWTLWQGVSRASQRISGQAGEGRRWLRLAALLLLAAGLAFSGASTALAYFHTWGRSPDLFYAYDVGLTRVADYMNALPDDERVYLTPTRREHYTLEFLSARPFASFDGRAGLVLPPPGQSATVLVLVREDEVTLPALRQARPDGQITWTLADSYGRPYAVAYRLPATAAGGAAYPPPDHPVGATIGDSVRLLGYSLARDWVRAGDTLHVTLHWQSLAPLDDDYTVFTHLLGDHNPATNGPVWAGHDSQPDGGQYPTTAWQPGEVILDVHPLIIPGNAPPGEYQLEAGLYLLATMTRLTAADAIGTPLPGDAVILGPVEVREKE